jgi:hypothetical protein
MAFTFVKNEDVAGASLPDELPSAWVARASSQAGRDVPLALSEPAPSGRSADEDDVRRVVDEVKDVIFRAHGLAG